MIEVVVVLAIVGFIAAVALPNFRVWIRNAQIRSTAESILSGLQLTRAEAVRRNTAMRFQFVTSATNSCTLSTSTANWIVSQRDPTSKCATTPADSNPGDATDPLIKQVRFASEGAATVTVTATASTVTYNAIGQLASGANTIDVALPTSDGTCAAAGGNLRCLRVEVLAGGQTRMCDPARTSTVTAPDPQAC